MIGAVLGAVMGGSIGRSMDEADLYCTGQTLEHVPDRQPIKWRNPDDNRSYVVTPTKSYLHAGGYCREYTTKSTIKGTTRQVTNTACRQNDGAWRIES